MPRPRRALFRPSLLVALLVCLLVSVSLAQPAAAATPSGELVFSQTETGITIEWDAPDPDRITARQYGVASTRNWRFYAVSCDPRTQQGWPAGVAHAETQGCLVNGHSSMSGAFAQQTIEHYGSRFFVVYSQQASGLWRAESLWDSTPAPPEPEPTTTPPTTTAPPTTSEPPPTTTPPTETTPPTTEPTTPPTSEPPPTGTPGGTITCTEAAPCYVHQVNPVPVDVGSIEVSALTEDQWGEMLLAMGALVFFAGAHFVGSWRQGRSR